MTKDVFEVEISIIEKYLDRTFKIKEFDIIRNHIEKSLKLKIKDDSKIDHCCRKKIE